MNKAFTLIEILVVIGIIGLLAAIGFIALNPAKHKAGDAKRKNDINQIGRFLQFGCHTPDTGTGTYDLNELIEELKSKYPKYANQIPNNFKDPKTGTDTESNYKYTVNAEGDCVLYANLENPEEDVTLPNLNVPTPGGGKGVLESSANGWNGTNKYFQVSN